ncbi:MAG: hypothetical protein GF331_03620 [Chitinivibrionales bacterium]|nr:hypothetical protein [Chitinivibrionales bacterium]
MMLQRMVLAFLLVVMLACSGSDDVAITQTGNPTNVSLVMQVDTTRSALPKRLGATAVSQVTITAVRIVVREVEFRSATADSLTSEHESPYLLDLDLGGQSTVFDTLMVVNGSVYDSAEVDIGPLTIEDSALYAANPSMRDISVWVHGYLNGTPDSIFTFTSALWAEQALAFSTPLDLSQPGSTSVLFTIRAGSWFIDATGAPLDPRVSDNRSLIEDNIESSFDVSEGR